MKKRLLFIHVAKTGGSSIRKMLLNSNSDIEFDCLHNGKLITFQNKKIFQRVNQTKVRLNEYEQIAYFVRNPYDRLVSCYNYFRGGGLNQFKNNLFQNDQITQDKIIKQFPLFSDCCQNLEQFCKVVTHAKPMSDFILNNQLSKMNSKNIFEGRFENYNEDVVSLFSKLGLSIFENDILKINLSSNNKNFQYNDSMRNKVYQFYKNDFSYFNYEK